MRVEEKERERERRGVAYPRQNNYLPFLYAGGTFSPLKTWEGEPPLEVCEQPPVERERMHIYTYAHPRECVCTLYTLGHSSSSRRTLPRPHETEAGFSLYRYSTMKQTGESECMRIHTHTRARAQSGTSARACERKRERNRYAMVKIYGVG